MKNIRELMWLKELRETKICLNKSRQEWNRPHNKAGAVIPAQQTTHSPLTQSSQQHHMHSSSHNLTHTRINDARFRALLALPWAVDTV
jgi:hypothetical protein